jgi:energy-coupling factor transport system permease protein
VQRSRYRPDPWGAPELLTVAVGVAVAGLGWWLARAEVAVAYPGVESAPYLSPTALLVGLLGTIPAVATPVPASALAPATVETKVEVAA